MQKVDTFIAQKENWQKELTFLREILKKTELVEDFKWRIPVYTINGKNVVGLGAFKQNVGLWFFQGSFLKDKAKVLINAQEGKTKGMRHWKFTSITEMDPKLITQYLEEAIQNQKEGKEIKVERKKSINIPKELLESMKTDQELKKCFDKLTPGNQKLYAEYITEAKRETTKQSRLVKITPMIKEGVGLHDKYKNC